MTLKQLLELITSDTKILVIFNNDSVIKSCDYLKYEGLKIVKLRVFKGDDTLRVYIRAQFLEIEMTVKDLLKNHDKTDHIYVIYIYRRTFKNCLYESQFFKLPKCISEREIVKWSVVEGSDAWIYLNIKVK